jgi:hypothetical protein
MLVFLLGGEVVFDDFGESFLAERVTEASILLSQNSHPTKTPNSRATSLVAAFFSDSRLQKLCDEIFSSLIDKTVLVMISLAAGSLAKMHRDK